MKNWKTWLSLCLITTGMYWLGGCQRGDLTLGDKIVPGDGLNIMVVDTFTVKTSTVAVLDTFATSADSAIYIGRWRDANSGTQDFTGYATPVFPANNLADILGQVTFDSLVLQMPYSYAYGDTLGTADIAIHTLNEVIESDVYYNSDSFAYSTKPIYQKSFVPKRREIGNFRFRLPVTLGQALFTGLRERTITDDVSLQAVLAGLAFKATPNRNLIMGLNVVSDLAAIKVYYHENAIEPTAESVDIKLLGPHFSNITNNFKGTPMEKLVQSSDYVNSTLTANRSYITTGGRLRTRLEFPYLDMLKGSSTLVGVNRAELVFVPIRSTLRDNTPPPSTLTLYQMNNNNEIIAVVPTTPGGTTAVSGGYAYGNGIEFINNYTFAMTAYMQQLFKGQVEARPLLLNVGTSATTLNFSRVSLGNSLNSDYRVKLKLYYTTKQ
jgi:hypothetical protein